MRRFVAPAVCRSVHLYSVCGRGQSLSWLRPFRIFESEGFIMTVGMVLLIAGIIAIIMLISTIISTVRTIKKFKRSEGSKRSGGDSRV